MKISESKQSCKLKPKYYLHRAWPVSLNALDHKQVFSFFHNITIFLKNGWVKTEMPLLRVKTYMLLNGTVTFR